MNYKVGDKVLLNNQGNQIWEITDIEVRLNGMFDVEIYNEYMGVKIWVLSSVLRPIQSAHDKLLAMGWEEKIHDIALKQEVESGKYKQYVKNSEVILLDIKGKEYTIYTLYNGSKEISDVAWIDLKLSRILTQLLEELT